MTTFDRFDPFERRIGEALDGIAPLRSPDYLDDLLRQTARTRQRPRWTFIERWLPMDTTLGSIGDRRRVPLRPIVLLAVLSLAVAAAVGASLLLRQPAPVLPDPFGPARNGLVAYEASGDLFLADVSSGTSRRLASGVGSGALFDRAGTRIATARTYPPNTVCYGPPPVPACTVDIVLTTLDGQSTVITPSPLPWPALLRDWSADGAKILVSGPEGNMSIVGTDGSGVRTIGATSIAIPGFAPPDSTSIWTDDGPPEGARPVRIGLDGTVLTSFPTTAARSSIEYGASPDGRLAIGGDATALLIATRDGAIERAIELGPGIEHIGGPAWSPDGSAIVINVIRAGVSSSMVVDPAGIRPNLALDPRASSSCEWSPDGASLLCSDDEGGWWIVGPSGGATQTSWPGTEISFVPSWQRLAR